MKLYVKNTANEQIVWTENDWPVVPSVGQTVIFGGRELEVDGVDHNFQDRVIDVWVHVPLVEVR